MHHVSNKVGPWLYLLSFVGREDYVVCFKLDLEVSIHRQLNLENLCLTPSLCNGNLELLKSTPDTIYLSTEYQKNYQFRTVKNFFPVMIFDSFNNILVIITISSRNLSQTYNRTWKLGLPNPKYHLHSSICWLKI